MNEKMKQDLYKACEELDKDEFFISLYGFTPEQEKSYIEEHFVAELEHLRTFLKMVLILFIHHLMVK